MMRYKIFLTTIILLFVTQFSFGEYILQIGVFKNKINAEKLTTEVRNKGYQATLIELNDGFCRVWIRKFSKETEAKKIGETIKKLGYPVFIKKIEGEKKIKETVVKKEVKESKEVKKVKETKEVKVYKGPYSQILVETFSEHKSAEKLRDELSRKGYFSYILVEKNNYKVMAGQTLKESLEEIVEKLKKDGYKPILVP